MISWIMYHQSKSMIFLLDLMLHRFRPKCIFPRNSQFALHFLFFCIYIISYSVLRSADCWNDGNMPLDKTHILSMFNVRNGQKCQTIYERVPRWWFGTGTGVCAYMVIWRGHGYMCLYIWFDLIWHMRECKYLSRCFVSRQNGFFFVIKRGHDCSAKHGAMSGWHS